MAVKVADDSDRRLEKLKKQVELHPVPRHVAVIMDGNGRWAKQQGRPRVFGHRNGVKAVRAVTEGAAEMGVSHLTLYAFSTENWKRPALEVQALMSLLVQTVKSEIKTLNKNNIRLEAIGDLQKLPDKSRKALENGISDTASNTGMTLILALNYSARWDILQATQSIAKEAQNNQIDPNDIDEEVFEQHLSTKNYPDPELMIRTSGESRISNFLLWQLAYAELYFTPIFWPEFRKEHFYTAILDFQNRERRFGKISEQLSR
jgi:undecaprenyl diphosphate synthase